MNSKQRIGKVMQGQKTDRRAFGMMTSLYGFNYVDDEIIEFYRNPQIWFKGQEKIIDLLEPDMISGPFVLSYDAEVFGSKITFPKNCAPNIKKPAFQSADDFLNSKDPNLNHPSIQFNKNCLNLLSKRYNEEKIIIGILSSPTDLPALLFGIQKWIDILLFEKEKVDDILIKTSNYFINVANKLLEFGAHIIATTVNFSNPSIVSKTIFDKISKHLESALSQVKSPVVLHHGGCKVGSFAEKYSHLQNVAGLVLDSHDDIKGARGKINENSILFGNLSGPLLNKLNSENAAKITRKLLDKTKNDMRYIFLTSDADIELDTEEDVLMSISKSIKEF